MSALDMLKADERLLAKRLRLLDYFSSHKNYLLFVFDMKKILEKRFGKIAQSNWAKIEVVDLVKAVLELNDEFFDYVSKEHAFKNRSCDVSHEEWEHMCTISAKVMIQMGWEYES